MLKQEEISELCLKLMKAEPGSLGREFETISKEYLGISGVLLASCIVNLDERIKAIEDREEKREKRKTIHPAYP